MSVHQDSTGIDRDSHIRAIAYSLWEDEGRPDGKAEEHWLKACELVASAEAKAAGILEPGWLKRTEQAPAEAVAAASEPKTETPAPAQTETVKRLRTSRAA